MTIDEANLTPDDIDAQPGIEHRRHQRFLTLKTGKVLTKLNVTECAVLNVSTSGACILIPKGCALPEHFDLVVDRSSLRFACRLIWTSGPMNGVAFSDRVDFCPAHWAFGPTTAA
jgi:hypothetical protein